MQNDLATKMVDQYESGQLSRRELVSRLMGLGAAVAGIQGGHAWSQSPEPENRAVEPARATFEATGLDHIALDVTDVARSTAFYEQHLGLRRIRGGANSAFLGEDRRFFLALFRADQPRMNHYCYAIRDYDPDNAVERLTAVGLEPRRVANRVYFPDPDGLTVQVTGR